MENVSSSYFDAASLTGALLAASFLHCLGAWTSRRGLAGMDHRGCGLELHDEQLQLASSGNWFSKIGHI